MKLDMSEQARPNALRRLTAAGFAHMLARGWYTLTGKGVAATREAKKTLEGKGESRPETLVEVEDVPQIERADKVLATPEPMNKITRKVVDDRCFDPEVMERFATIGPPSF